MWTAEIDLPSQGGILRVEFVEGETILVCGPNGSGKSSLLHELARISIAGHKSEILPGHRQIIFQSDDIDQIGMSIDQLESNIKNSPAAFNRFRGTFGEAHLKSFVKRAASLETDINFKIAQMVRDGVDVGSFTTENLSIIRTINSIFTTSNLDVRLCIDAGEIRAERSGTRFKLDRLSDGERAALLLVCSVLSQGKAGILIIDEPEKHLNPAISGPLIASSFRARPDLCFVIASHDLSLLRWLKPRQILHLKNSTFTPSLFENYTENRSYSIDVINYSDGVSDEIKQSILGSKDRILFVEGTSESDDCMLYRQIYANTSVVARGGWESVVSNVRVLRKSGKYAWLDVFGLIDSDGRDISEINAYKNDQIFCVDAPTIENLFLSEEILLIMAQQHFALHGGQDVDSRLRAAKNEISVLLIKHKSDIVYKKSLWRINRLVSEQKIALKDLFGKKSRTDEIIFYPIIMEEYALFEAAVDHDDPFVILSRVPIKNTSIPGRIAKAVGYEKFSDLKQAVMKKIDDGGPIGEQIISVLKIKLPSLPN